MSYSSLAGPSTQQTFSQSGFPSQPSQPGYSQNYAQFGAPDIPPQAAASVSEILLDPLARLQTLSNTVFQSLGPPQSRPPPPPSVGELLAVDAQLAAAVQVARTHQVKQRRIEQLKDEVLDLDRRWREIVRALDEGRRELDAIVREGEERIKAIDEAKAGKLFVLCVSLRIHEAVRVRPPVHTSVGAASFFAYIAPRVYDAIRHHRQRISLCDAVVRERQSYAL